MPHKGKESASRKLVWVEGQSFAGWGCSENLTTEQIQAVPCPTCGAEPREKCVLNNGQPRTEPHRDRQLTAEDLLGS
jgi:hypothetical protein